MGKRDTNPRWVQNCPVCGQDIELCPAYENYVGNEHLGCLGYPYCQCDAPHTGDCSSPKWSEEDWAKVKAQRFRQKAWFWLTPFRYSRETGWVQEPDWNAR